MSAVLLLEPRITQATIHPIIDVFVCMYIRLFEKHMVSANFVSSRTRHNLAFLEA